MAFVLKLLVNRQTNKQTQTHTLKPLKTKKKPKMVYFLFM